ncbi:MAG: phage baseplate assembly protein V [Treponema sp.]|nr:phage baseplate assembly protein V [Treponema sp.]
MNYKLEQKLKELLKKYPDPRNKDLYGFNQTKFHEENAFVFGIVVDNKDPDCLGRVRVQMDLLAPGCVGPWYHMSNMWTGNQQGFWTLPDLGTQVLVCFPNGNLSQGIVLGCIYDEKHLPPEVGAEKPTQSYLWQTKAHRIEIVDDSGKEGIHIETAQGKMRCVISSDKGIEITNELGDIAIKCKKLTVKTDKNIELNGEKTVSLTCEDAMSMKSSKDTIITCDKDVTIKGKNVKLSGSKGVATEGKQIATEDDKVMGLDTHMMVIPAGMSTATVPLPHPFIGKINDKVSKDVKIKDKGVAVKGSKAKHDDSMHMQLPGTIKFQNNPKKEGEVTGGTGSKVKVNGKEVAVIGSQVTTCNDMGMQNNSTIIAVGMSIPMPAIINPANTEEFERERKEQEDKEPKFSDVKWASSSVDEGAEAELSASVQDIADGNMVTLLVFPEGKGPEDSIPIATFPCTVKSGSVSAKWSYRANPKEMPPDSDPKFTFTAHCAWCNFEKSSNSLEVKLVRPEIKKVEWQDKDGNSTSKGLVGEVLKLHAETKDMEGGVTFFIYDSSTGKQVTSIGAKIEGDKADAEWTYHYNGEKLDAKPKFKIEATGNRCKKVESGDVEISAKIKVKIKNKIEEAVSEQPYSLYLDGEVYESGESDSEGLIEYENLVPGNYQILIKSSSGE